MRTPLTTLGTWLTRPLTSLFLLLVMLTLSSQAMAAAPVITNPATGSTLPSVAVGQSMSIVINSVGGAQPLDKWVECDANDPDYDGVTPCLPPGLILDPSPGSSNTILHGTPTTAGTYTFSITLNDGLNQGGVATYTLVVTSSATPTLTAVTPNNGSTAGATSVTLTGTNLTGATAVSFGGTSATGYIVNNATTITATTPAHAAGAVNVVVTTPGGTATLTNGYTYNVPPPTVGPVSATVAANSSANPITLSLSGGAASSVAVATAASHGTATASGTSITYTPTAGYSGSDSFTYTATNASGTSSPATVTITVSAPTLAITPTTLPDGIQGTAYNQTVTATGGTTPYTYAISAGSLPAGLSLNTSSGVISGTPTVSGTFNLTVTATDANSATGSRAYTLQINGLPPVANAVSATVAANSSANPITLNITGGAASSVAIATAASHGTATASGTSITYTPTAGYSGSDSFTYTATNASGTSSPATVTITVSAPSITLSPGSLSNGSVGTAYSQTVTATGGTAPYTYAITSGSLPAGLILNTTTGAISGTPMADGTLNLTITATDANSATGSQAFSITIGVQAPVANAVSATVAANSSANPITLNITGGAASSVAIATAASHGTATASGTSITYTPTAGYSGSDSFTYTATNASGTSSPATVTITVSAPSITLSPGSLSNGSVGTAYSQTVTATGGTAPYTYAITSGSLPAGLILNTATGAISGTPMASGTLNLTITATDANSATGSQAFSITIGVQAPVANAVSATVAANSSANPITLNITGGAASSVAIATAASHGTATASGTSITYTPIAGYSGSDSFTYTATNAGGTSSPATVTLTVSAPSLVLTPASLGAGTAGSAYSATLSATGGTAPYTYAITSGSLPAGLSLNTASGLISGTPTTSGSSNLSITVTDANGATGSQTYTLTIAAVAITVPASSQILAAGQSATVDLTQGATGGPFTQAVLGSVTPASAGRAMMIGRFSMRFVPSAAFAGTAVVSFSLQNGSGASAASTVSFMIQERPDPTKDAEVIGLLNAQTRAAERFASTQMDNFNRRLEQLHQISCERNSLNASLRKEGRDVPLGEIAKAVQDQLGGTANQTEQEKREAAAALQDNCKQDALAFWSDGFVNVGSTHTRGARDNSFTTLGLSVGVDYRLSPSAIAGVGIGYGNDRSDIGKNHTRSDGDAIGIATYLSLNLAPQVFVDGLLGYNRISFDSRRYITGSNDDYARGSRDADQLFASLTASYEYRQGPLSLTPYSRLNASTTRLDAYRESGGGIYGLSYDEQRQQNFTSYLGVRSGYDLMTRIGVVTPKVGLAWGHNFSSSSDYKMRYTDQGDEGTLYRLKPDALDSDFASLDMGVDFNLGRAWQLGVSYKTALGSDERNDTFRLGLNGKF
ncbi:cell surface receptor IPT/TIG domain-containing protein [Pseudomonas sp. Os17]|uniref:putative Ig domain-containing protein n=1 Tax=Pseudomonas sp. Os17 TaxID=1500686 RepID=UPI0005FCD12D|nr:putative Ig domain-containing protein [Pseudomonas sp. Os17]BAQ75352.1 cell surface receptor IPT/TIG domain-containing protein [Pseudomonas sp. Os17]